MLCMEIIAVCSQSHTKHINTLCGQNVELLYVEPGVTYTKHLTLNTKPACPYTREMNGEKVLTPIASPTRTHARAHAHTHTLLLLTSVTLFCAATVQGLKAVPQIRWIAHTNFSGGTPRDVTHQCGCAYGTTDCYLYICGIRTAGSRTCALTFQLTEHCRRTSVRLFR